MKMRILIVEDELGARRLMEYLLGAYYQVASVTNGREAIRWLDDGNKVDLIISDIEMPQMTGLEMVAYMKEEPLYSSIPYLLVSSRERSSLEEEMTGLKDANYLNKPLQPKTLYWKVEELLMNSVSY